MAELTEEVADREGRVALTFARDRGLLVDNDIHADARWMLRDGATFTMGIDCWGRYRRSAQTAAPTPDDVPPFVHGHGLECHPLLGILLDGGAGLRESLVELCALTSETRDGRDGHRLAFTLSTGWDDLPHTDASLWIDAEDGRVRELHLAATESMSAWSERIERPRYERFDVTVTFDDVRTRVADDALDVEPPDDLEHVERFDPRR